MNEYFKPETFYKSVNCDCHAVIYIEHNGVVRILRGSTIVTDRPDPDKEPEITRRANELLIEMLVLEAVDTRVPYKIELIDDYKFITIESATELLIGRDDVRPEDYWVPIFPDAAQA